VTMNISTGNFERTYNDIWNTVPCAIWRRFDEGLLIDPETCIFQPLGTTVSAGLDSRFPGKTRMSKNFELMQELLKRELREAPPGPEVDRAVLLGSEGKPRPPRGSADLDEVGQQECFRLVQRIFLEQPESLFRAIVFAGIDRGNGCSRICAEVARILAANTSRSVCLVDANLRTPSLPGFLGVPDTSGLVRSLLEEGDIRSFAKQLKPSNLWLLSGGTLKPESHSLLNSDGLKLRLQELRKEFDYILIDTPALNLYADALTLGRIADGVVVVVQADSTRRESALKGLQTLRDAHIEVLGAVLNRRTFPIPGFVYRRL
jgi:capsular exopolysaccharide synthesis family protein